MVELKWCKELGGSLTRARHAPMCTCRRPGTDSTKRPIPAVNNIEQSDNDVSATIAACRQR